MTLVDVLMTEHLLEVFQEAVRERPGVKVALLPASASPAEVPLGAQGSVARIETTDGGVLDVTAGGVFRVVGERAVALASFDAMVGYDWISADLDRKVALKDEHYDRLILHLAGARDVTLDHLGEAVYPLMTYLGRALATRSQKVLLRGLDDDVVTLLGRCLQAAVEGPFFADDELDQLFSQDRASLAVVASMWTRMNLASPDLRRTVTSVVEMLLERRSRHPEAWADLVDAPPDRVRGALEVFKGVVKG